MNVHLIHYSQAECDTIWIRKYAQQSNYTLLADSIMAGNKYYAGDTMTLFFVDRQAHTLEELQTEYDLEIVNPSDNKAIRIFDIEREQATQEVCHGGLFGGGSDALACNNKLLGFNYSVNNGTIQAIGNEIIVSK